MCSKGTPFPEGRSFLIHPVWFNTTWGSLRSLSLTQCWFHRHTVSSDSPSIIAPVFCFCKWSKRPDDCSRTAPPAGSNHLQAAPLRPVFPDLPFFLSAADRSLCIPLLRGLRRPRPSASRLYDLLCHDDDFLLFPAQGYSCG